MHQHTGIDPDLLKQALETPNDTVGQLVQDAQRYDQPLKPAYQSLSLDQTPMINNRIPPHWAAAIKPTQAALKEQQPEQRRVLAVTCYETRAGAISRGHADQHNRYPYAISNVLEGLMEGYQKIGATSTAQGIARFTLEQRATTPIYTMKHWKPSRNKREQAGSPTQRPSARWSLTMLPTKRA